MRKLFVAFVVILLISSWAVFKLSKDNQALRKEVYNLKQKIESLEQPQQDKGTVNFLPTKVKEIYDFAQENQGLLKKLNCYCGCQNPMHQPYHKNLANCFVIEITAEGQIFYDSHGENCKTCIDEATDVKKWLDNAKNYQTIKNSIDSKYKPPIMNPSH